MAYQLNNNDIVAVKVQYAWDGVELMFNLLHYRLLSGGPVADGAAAILELIQHIGNGAAVGTFAMRWTGLAGVGPNIDRFIGQRVYPVRYAQVEFNTGIVGGSETEALPPPVQLAITKRGEIAARHAIGGIRVPGLATEFEVNCKLTGPGQTAADLLANTLKGDLTPPASSNVWTPVVYRRLNPGSSVQVTQTVAHPILRVQRTRIPGKGV